MVEISNAKQSPLLIKAGSVAFALRTGMYPPRVCVHILRMCTYMYEYVYKVPLPLFGCCMPPSLDPLLYLRILIFKHY